MEFVRKFNARLWVAGLIALAALLASVAFLSGCSSVVLDKETYLKTAWGPAIQYKINSEWKEAQKDDQSLSSANVSYTADNTHLFIVIRNPDDSSYRFSSTSTYDEWEAWTKEYYSKPDQQLSKYGITYSDFSFDSLGNKQVGNLTYQIYRISYMFHYSDEAYQKIKENNPDSQVNQDKDMTSYYALVKNGELDLEVSASSEEILNAVLGSLTIKM